MTLHRLLGISIRRSPLLLLGLVIPAVLAGLLLDSRPRVYQVSATLLPAQLRVAGDPAFAAVSLSRLVGMSTNYAYSAKSPDLLTTVGGQLGLAGTPDDLAKRVDASVDTTTAALMITARAGDAASAAALANAVAHAIEAKSSPRSPVQNDATAVADLATLRTRMMEAQQEYQRLLALPPPRTSDQILALGNALTLLHELTTEYDSVTASLNTTPSGLTVVDEADALRAVEIAPRTLYFTLLAAIAGLLIAAGIVSFLEYADDTVKGPDDIREVTGLRTLGAIGSAKRMRGRREKGRLSTLISRRSGVAEEYRMLRARIEFAGADVPVRTLLVTSSVRGEGKTITAANLAVAFAQAGRRVLLVDANLRNPGVHLVFGVHNAKGLTTLLLGDEGSPDAVVQGTEQPNLRILTSGPLPPNPAELLGGERMRAILDQLKASDLVVVDSPPLLAVADSAILSSFLDGTLLVIRAGRSRRGDVRLGRASLQEAHATVLGAVLNRTSRARYPDHGDASRDAAADPVAAAGALKSANPT